MTTRLETLLLEGLAKGDDIPLMLEFWKDLKAEVRGIAAKQGIPPSAAGTSPHFLDSLSPNREQVTSRHDRSNGAAS